MQQFYQAFTVALVILSAYIIFRLVKKTGNPKLRGYTNINAGWEYEKKGQLKEALAEYKLAEAYFREIKHELILAKVMLVQALVYKRLKDFDSASEYFEEAISMGIPLKDPEGVGEVYMEYGEMCMELKRYAEAEKCYTEAFGIWQEAGNRPLAEQALLLLGTARDALPKI